MLTADRDVVEGRCDTPGPGPWTTSRLSGNSVPRWGRTTSNRGQVLPGEARPSRPCAAGASNLADEVCRERVRPADGLGLTGLTGCRRSHVLSWAIRVGCCADGMLVKLPRRPPGSSRIVRFSYDTPPGESSSHPRRRSDHRPPIGDSGFNHSRADRRMAGQRKGVSIGVNNRWIARTPNHADRMDGIRDRSDSAEINPGRRSTIDEAVWPLGGHNRLSSFQG